MGVVDAFREVPLPDSVTAPSPTGGRGKGKRSGGKQASPKARSKGKGRAQGGRARGRGARGRGAQSPSPITSSSGHTASTPVATPTPIGSSPDHDTVAGGPSGSQSHQLSLEQINLVALNRNQALARRRQGALAAPRGMADNVATVSPPQREAPAVGVVSAMPVPVGPPHQTAAPSPTVVTVDPSPPSAALATAASHLQVHQLLIGRAQGSQLEMRQLEWLSRRCGFQLWRPTTSTEVRGICQDALLQGEPVATTPCIHHFHASCLARCQSAAFANSGVCPCCRSSLGP
jgi:hypothetical protein